MLPLKRAKDGSIISLGDVARIELGAGPQELFSKEMVNRS